MPSMIERMRARQADAAPRGWVPDLARGRDEAAAEAAMSECMWETARRAIAEVARLQRVAELAAAE